MDVVAAYCKGYMSQILELALCRRRRRCCVIVNMDTTAACTRGSGWCACECDDVLLCILPGFRLSALLPRTATVS